MRESRRLTEEGVGEVRRGRRGPHFKLERRQHPRRPAVDYRVWLGGWITDLDFVTIAAQVDNLSEGGMLVIAPIAFPKGADVWLRLGDPGQTDCVRGQILETSRTDRGDFFIRVKFRQLCPRGFFEAVTQGLVPDGVAEVDRGRSPRPSTLISDRQV